MGTQSHMRRFVGDLVLAVILAGRCIQAQDVAFMGIVKGIAHHQSGPSAVALQTDPFQLSAFIDMSGAGSVLGATMTPAGKSPTPLLADGESLDYSAAFSSKAALDAAVPNGNDTLALTGRNEGARSVILELALDAYPPIPTVQEFNSLQAVPAGEPLPISWPAFIGGTDHDFIQLAVHRMSVTGEETVFESPGPGEPGRLNGASTSVTIPVGHLASGQSYVGRLLFARIVDRGESFCGQGVTSIGAFFRETTFPIVTGGMVDVGPPDSGFRARPPMTVQSIQWTGVDGARFTYRWSGDRQVFFCLYPERLPGCR